MAGSALAGYEVDRWQTSFVPTSVSLKTVTETVVGPTSTRTVTSTQILTAATLRFYYDPDLDGVLNPKDPELQDLAVEVDTQEHAISNNRVVVPAKSIVELTVRGTSPTGKPLSTATFMEPLRPVMLPRFQCQTEAGDASIGLADGPATSPIKPSDVNINDYEYFRLHPEKWRENYSKYYPPGLPYEPNYFFYGCLEPGSYGVPEGKPHLAFDVWAADGTPVHACWGGTIVSGLYDWKFGIDSGNQVAYYNHLVPSVKIGDIVRRYDLLGNIEKGLGHVHFELRPDPTAILNAFTTLSANHVLTSPLRGEKVAVLPYFAQG